MKHLHDFLRHIRHKSRSHREPHSTPPPGFPPEVSGYVFAHFIVGNAYSMTPEQWEYDIQEAQKAHIDGFALNVAPQDDYTDRVVQTAYNAAEKIGDFSLFLSFDYLSGGPWPADRVVKIINEYKHRSAQFHFQGRPMVSTFEGPGNAADWLSIKSATGCTFVPSWTSMGPNGIRSVFNTIDGHFSWDAWPIGAQEKSTASDVAWINALAGKPYMMPVSPWFYTNLPQWGKNWLWRGDDLWHYRWEQVIELRPPLVQILSWNDYGESHYIGPIYEPGLPEGSSRYVSNHPHDAWRTLLPYYIDAYKQNRGINASAPHKKDSIAFPDKIVYWYRLNPGCSGSASGTTGNCPSMGQETQPPSKLSQDRVFVTTVVSRPSEVHVQIGGGAPTVLAAKVKGLNHFSVAFDARTGPVRIAIVRDGQESTAVVGPDITEQGEGGNVDWNAFVGSSEE